MSRFDTVLMQGSELSEQRRRLLTSALMATTLCLGAGIFAWVGDKMGISMVTPPKNTYAVTFSMGIETPPPPAPPARPAGSAAEEESEPQTPDEVEPPEPDEAPLEVTKLDLSKPPRVKPTVPGDAKGGIGVPGGGRHGVPNGTGTQCLIPPCLGTPVPTGGGPPPIPTRTVNDSPVQAPFDSVKATGVYTPDPDQKKLSRTATALGSRKSGKTTVAFCINGDGRTYDVKVRKRFGGDPQVDQICRETVAKWRFSPRKVAGKARSVCSAVTFDLRFD